MMMKKLTRIRLINWHYFVNETISVNGSFLISGENTSGKSTILDAIQLVLTTNQRRFNTAANEKSSRDLKGYVRCKTGAEGNVFNRKGSVITYVALEFFEEKSGRYFTIGTKIDSPDEESKLTTKWFCEECRLEDISFVCKNRPSTTDEFRKDDKPITLIYRVSEAKRRFGRRLGNLEDRFFDIIPKSLAFKPMDNVKDFINKFILSEKTIEVETLRHNIASLKELEDLMNNTKEKISDLEIILEKNNEIIQKERDIKINEIMIKKAEIEGKKQEVESYNKKNHMYNGQLLGGQNKLQSLEASFNSEREYENNLRITLGNNETTKLISDIKHRIEILNKDKDAFQKSKDKLDGMIKTIENALTVLNKFEIYIISKEQLLRLGSEEKDNTSKTEDVYNLKKELNMLLEKYTSENVRQKDKLKNLNDKRIFLNEEISNLKNKKLTFPDNTVKLMTAIKKEFLKLGIDGEPRIFSNLLEITDPKWQNAIEGYLNKKRFYIIVQPQHYEIAYEVYNKIKNDVHTVGLVNANELDIDATAEINSLAYVIKSENRWARAYGIYLLNEVIRCDELYSVTKQKIGITPDCILYKDYAIRRIDEKIYQTPFIGASAIEIQLKNKIQELEKLNLEISQIQENLKKLNEIIENLNLCNINVIEENLQSPQNLANTNAALQKEKIELQKSESDPSYIQIGIQIEESEKRIKQLSEDIKNITENNGSLKEKIQNNIFMLENIKEEILRLEMKFNQLCEIDSQITQFGLEKYKNEIKIKDPETIVRNFSPVKVGIENKKEELITELTKLQLTFCSINDSDFGSGENQIQEYIDEHHKLVSSDIIKYEEDLEKAKSNCHLEFRESFLARLKENIDNAKLEFKNLNAALKDIYYGEDSYKFLLDANKQKKSIYTMINSNKNEQGYNLWTKSFEDEYKEEMDDLFSKLTAYDDKGEKVLSEYTDYRSYLDYDISVENINGTVQLFSKIYGEKSGGETQTPYYVAIAASFSQLYKIGDTIRIIMFDEAFDKMDDNRISSMMDFLNKQNFQIILATPPAKLEVIGEKVDTILMTMREGANSIIEEYDL